MHKATKLAALCAAAVTLSGCASLMHGPYEKITVTSTPERALCKIYREGQGYVKSVATPDSVYLMRDHNPITVKCAKAGYRTTSIEVGTARAEQDNIGNISTYGAGFVVDLANSTQDRLPDTVHVDMAER